MTAQREELEISAPAGRFSAYLSVPERAASVGVVVLQEIFGVNANIRAICDRFAAAGYPTIAPDLYWRQERGVELDPASEAGRARAMELMKGLNREEAVADATAALDALRLQVPGLERSAAVGYCFGGGIAYLMAARGLVDAGVAYYGTGLHTMLPELDRPQHARLLLHIAGEDHLCPPEAQDAIRQAADKAGNNVDVVIHSGVGHAFARAGGLTFDRAAADRANGMTMDLLSEMTGPA